MSQIKKEEAAAIRDAVALVRIIQRHGLDDIEESEDVRADCDVILGRVSFDELSRMVGVLAALASQYVPEDKLHEGALNAIGMSE